MWFVFLLLGYDFPGQAREICIIVYKYTLL